MVSDLKRERSERDMFQDPSGSDGGTYRCHVKNEFGESNANLNLNIEAEPEPEGEGPSFVEKPRITSHHNGKLVIMDCKVCINNPCVSCVLFFIPCFDVPAGPSRSKTYDRLVLRGQTNSRIN